MTSEFLVKFGFLLTVGSVILAVYTGNLFGFSRGVRENLEGVKDKGEISKREKSYFSYFVVNEFIRKLWKFLFVFGLLLLCLGLFI